MMLLSGVSYLYYSGMQGSMERTGYNFGISMLISGTYEVIGNCAIGLIIDRISHRKGMLLSSVGLIVCGLSFALQVVKQHDGIQTVVISVSTLFNVFVFAYLVIIQMEIFSTETLSIVMGIANGTGSLANSIQPFIINWINGLSLHPAIFCGAVYLFLGILPVLVY